MVGTLAEISGGEENDGARLLAQSYTPYIQDLEKIDDTEANFGYTGQKYDAQTGLLYLCTRYWHHVHSPMQAGRFINLDIRSRDSNMPMLFNAWLYGIDDGNLPVTAARVCMVSGHALTT